MATFDELKVQATVIKNEILPSANTANRVGDWMEKMVDETSDGIAQIEREQREEFVNLFGIKWMLHRYIDKSNGNLVAAGVSDLKASIIDISGLNASEANITIKNFSGGDQTTLLCCFNSSGEYLGSLQDGGIAEDIINKKYTLFPGTSKIGLTSREGSIFTISMNGLSILSLFQTKATTTSEKGSSEKLAVSQKLYTEGINSVIRIASVVTDNYNFPNAGYLNNSGNIAAPAAYSTTQFIKVELWDTFFYTGFVGDSAYACFGYSDITGGNPVILLSNNTNYKDKKIEITNENIKYIRACGRNSDGFSLNKVISVSKAYSQVNKKQIETRAQADVIELDIKRIIAYKEESLLTERLDNGAYKKFDGTLNAVTGSNFSNKYTQKTTISSLDEIYYTGTTYSVTNAGVVYFDVDDNYIGYEFDGKTSGQNTSYTNEKLTIPTNATYVAFSSNVHDGLVFSVVRKNRVIEIKESQLPESVRNAVDSVPVIQEQLDSIEDVAGNKINLSDVTHILSYGQSLSVGVSGGDVVSTIQKYNNKMFIGGTMPQYSAISNPLSDWTALIEARVVATNGAGDETPLSGISDRFIQTLLENEILKQTDLTNTILFGSAPGEGGQSITVLSKGNSSGYYNRILTQVQAAYDIAQSKGYTYNVPFLFWTQGETDISDGTSPEVYKAMLIQLRDNINNDIKAITGQKNDVNIIMYQVASHNVRTPNNQPNIALTQLDIGLNNIGFYLATAMYHLEYIMGGANAHLPSKMYRYMGEYYGYVMCQVMMGINWKPMHIKSWQIQGNIIMLNIYAPVYPIVIDTSIVASIDNYGFSIKNTSGAEIIQSVEIVRGSSIRIICSEVVSGLTLNYAINGTGAGNIIGSRGNIRDSQGDHLSTVISGITYRMDNWLPISRIFL